MLEIEENDANRSDQTHGASAFGLVQVSRRLSTLEDELTQIKGVVEAYYVAPDNSYLVKLGAANNSELGDSIHEIEMLEGVVSTRTLVVLNTLKNSSFDNDTKQTGSRGQTSNGGTDKPYQRFLRALVERGYGRLAMHERMRVYDKPFVVAPAGIAGFRYCHNIGRDWGRVELYLSSQSRSENKAAFDVLSEQKSDIEHDFGGELFWQRLDDKLASRISKRIGTGGYNSNDNKWPEIQDEMIEAMVRLEGALRPRLESYRGS